ncbi:phospholipase/carboxylesterase [Arthrobacter stackebrandtii]|uniref:Phospholipase/carboxylesterase n=1 Tax=Arthrobacter stackebrandtii TaxID=272161 RepID=A0ABS4YVT3_9MICC|nr:phospholipase [Arthrobacter stackebrandtii]MBP2412907.1 phospholipase/carboxylesterase [Arthrobacter stackebrandtii]PYH01287.1 phospholipase [Arthrobacter stackebrandtii]
METVAWSCPENERAGRPLLLMLHGYGSDETRMSALFKDMPRGFVCAAPRAPVDISGDFGWFLLDYFLANDFAEVVAAATTVLAWLDTTMAKHQFSSVSVLGFSQGMAMATTLIRLRPEMFAAGVGLSGFALQNNLLGALEPLDRKIPFYWARDTADLVINPDAIEFTADWLAANTDLQQGRYEGMGHNFSPGEMTDVASFLTANVPGSFVPRG